MTKKGTKSEIKQAFVKSHKCRDCAHCTPDYSNMTLEKTPKPIFGFCPYKEHKRLLNHDYCEINFKIK
jgi:hypothetical protein